MAQITFRLITFAHLLLLALLAQLCLRTVIAARGLGGLKGTVSGRVAARTAVRAGANIFGEPGGVMMKLSELREVGLWDNSHPYLIDQATFIAVALRGDALGGVAARTPIEEELRGVAPRVASW